MILMVIATATATLSRVFTREKVRWLVIKQWTFLTINPYIIPQYTILRNMVMTRFIITVIVMLVVVLVLNHFGFSLLLQVFLFLMSGLVSGIGEELGRIIINKVEEWLSERDTVVIRI